MQVVLVQQQGWRIELIGSELHTVRWNESQVTVTGGLGARNQFLPTLPGGLYTHTRNEFPPTSRVGCVRSRA